MIEIGRSTLLTKLSWSVYSGWMDIDLPDHIWTKKTLSVSYLVLVLISLTGNLKAPSLVLLTANTALLPGESAEFRCAMTSHRPEKAEFRLGRNEEDMKSKFTDQNMMNYSLSSLVSSDQGSYTCYYLGYYDGKWNFSSNSNAITITIGKCMQNCPVCIYSSTWLLTSSMSDAYLLSASQMPLYVYITTHDYWLKVKHHDNILIWSQQFLKQIVLLVCSFSR